MIRLEKVWSCEGANRNIRLYRALHSSFSVFGCCSIENLYKYANEKARSRRGSCALQKSIRQTPRNLIFTTTKAQCPVLEAGNRKTGGAVQQRPLTLVRW